MLRFFVKEVIEQFRNPQIVPHEPAFYCCKNFYHTVKNDTFVKVQLESLTFSHLFYFLFCLIVKINSDFRYVNNVICAIVICD